MAPPPTEAPTAGVRKPPCRHPLPAGLSCDPIRIVVVAPLERGRRPAHIQPAKSEGAQVLLDATQLRPDRKAKNRPEREAAAKPRRLPSRRGAPIAPRTDAIRLTEETRLLQLADAATAPLSAIRVHPNLQDFAAVAQGLIAQPGWFIDPSLARVIASDPAEARLIEALLRQPILGGEGDGRSIEEDPLEAARWVAEELMPPYPGWRFDGTPAVLLLNDLPGDFRAREVFLTPGCWGANITAEELLPAVRAAAVGLHLARPAAG